MAKNESIMKIKSDEFRQMIAKKFANKGKGPNANMLTNRILSHLNVSGFKVWRQNTMGVFDTGKAVKRLVSLVQGFILKRQKATPTIIGKRVRETLKGCYRKNHGLNGVPDIIGHHKKTGKMIGVEVKVGKDKLSIHQSLFLDDLKRSGGISIVARDFESFVDELEKQL